MPQDDYAKCLHLTTQFIDSHYSFWFREPVDPHSEGAKAYYQCIQKPMDLGTVLSKLESGQYSQMADWQADVALVWGNAMMFNRVGSVYYQAAETLKKKFEKEISMFYMSEEEKWLRKVGRIIMKLEALETLEEPE
jgi:hypothetical protein